MLQMVQKIVPHQVHDVDLHSIIRRAYDLANQKVRPDSESTGRPMVAKSRSGLEKDFCCNKRFDVHLGARNLPGMRNHHDMMCWDEEERIYHRNHSPQRSGARKNCVKRSDSV
jgi:hypothetical protein